jgi:thiamine kinase-like enzyme
MPLEEPAGALEALVPGEGPLIVERLGSGLVNESYRVLRGGQAYTVRLPAAQAAELGLERAWECRVLERAASAGLAPRPARCDPARGLLVSSWVEGRFWSREEALSPVNMARVARLLRGVHGLSVAAPERRMSPADWIAHYSRAERVVGAGAGRAGGVLAGGGMPALKGAVSRGLEEAAALALARLGALPPPLLVLCHSDLHPANLVDTGRGLVLLDWEYAHVSEALWDVAGWACNTDMDLGGRTAFLRAYLGYDPSPAEAERLGVMAWLYDYVCLLWSEVYLRARPGEPAAGPISGRARELARRLALDAGSAR